ncbi:MAG: hypothetical protein SGI88_12060 [Candidatus Hydrogenedentes bacterium]|nr:hypothetical protein [Candidatus Hydrogenedentota bacterium]
MRVQTFMGRVSMESLQQLDNHVNEWLAEHNVEPKHIQQSCGYEHARDGNHPEPVVIVTVWY